MASVLNGTASYAKALLKNKSENTPEHLMNRRSHRSSTHSTARSVGTSSSTGDSDGHDDTSDWPELSYKQKFVAAPPPKENPWHINPNAAAVIAMKFPQSAHKEPPKPESLTDDDSIPSSNGNEVTKGSVEETVVNEKPVHTRPYNNHSRGKTTTPLMRGPPHAKGASNDGAMTSTRNGYGNNSRGRGPRNGNVSGMRPRGSYHGGKAYYIQSQVYYPDRMDSGSVHSETGLDEYKDFPPEYATITQLYAPITDYLIPYPPTFTPTAYATPIETTGIITLTDEQFSSYVVPTVDAVTIEMLKNQIEYYFSEENLAKDFFLRRKMDPEGFLPVHLIASFHRVKSMTEDFSIVVAAIQSSEKLELTEDLSYVRTIHNPTQWPILDSTNTVSLSISLTAMKIGSMLPSPTSPSTVTAESDGVSSTPVDSTVSMPSNGISLPPVVTGNEIGETFNPNVPEFVPKSMLY